MDYYIVSNGQVHDSTNDIDTAIYSCRELEKTTGKKAEIAAVIATMGPRDE